MRWLFLIALLLGLVAACGSRPHSPYPPAREDPSKRGDYVAGGRYAPHIQDRAPDHIPNVDAIPEPIVEALPLSRYGNTSPYQVEGRNYYVLNDATGFVETGLASYYGTKFHGRRTSSQEVYDMYAFTAAHKSLPLPSFARITNLDNGRSVVVRVNDRGPFHDGRVVDLSYAAAVKLGIHEMGLGWVEIRALTPEGAPLVSSPELYLQVGAFSIYANAEQALARLHAAGMTSAMLYDGQANGRPLWRLRLPVDANDAPALSRRISRMGLGTPQLVPY